MREGADKRELLVMNIWRSAESDVVGEKVGRGRESIYIVLHNCELREMTWTKCVNCEVRCSSGSRSCRCWIDVKSKCENELRKTWTYSEVLSGNRGSLSRSDSSMKYLWLFSERNSLEWQKHGKQTSALNFPRPFFRKEISISWCLIRSQISFTDILTCPKISISSTVPLSPILPTWLNCLCASPSISKNRFFSLMPPLTFPWLAARFYPQ